VPAIAPAELVEADGVLFGFPTGFGMLPAQMKAFFDGTSGLWCEQRLAGKPAGIFCSAACQGGGHETTACVIIIIKDFVIDLFH
jgi:NAD(P)H dehydrogenase (quinone)